MSAKSELSTLLSIEHDKYLESCAGTGGDSEGFRHWVRADRTKFPEKYDGHVDSTFDAAADRQWRKQPRDLPLFKVAGIALPDSILVPDDAKASGFAKIGHQFYTAGQYREAAIYQMRKAVEASTAAEAFAPRFHRGMDAR